MAQGILRFFQVGHIDNSADCPYWLASGGRITVIPPPIHGYPTDVSVWSQDSMDAIPCSLVGCIASLFHECVHGCSITFINEPRGIRIVHLRPYLQTQNGA